MNIYSSYKSCTVVSRSQFIYISSCKFLQPAEGYHLFRSLPLGPIERPTVHGQRAIYHEHSLSPVNIEFPKSDRRTIRPIGPSRSIGRFRAAARKVSRARFESVPAAKRRREEERDFRIFECTCRGNFLRGRESSRKQLAPLQPHFITAQRSVTFRGRARI